MKLLLQSGWDFYPLKSHLVKPRYPAELQPTIFSTYLSTRMTWAMQSTSAFHVVSCDNCWTNYARTVFSSSAKCRQWNKTVLHFFLLQSTGRTERDVLQTIPMQTGHKRTMPVVVIALSSLSSFSGLKMSIPIFVPQPLDLCSFFCHPLDGHHA